MPFYPRSAVPVAFTLLLCSTSAGLADPITGLYDIHVLLFSSLNGGVWQSVALDQRFTLRLTINPDLAEQFSAYGPASFSPLPLTPTAPPPDLPLTAVARTFEYVSPYRPLEVLRSASAQIFGERSAISPETHYESLVELFGVELLSHPSPVLTAERFLRNLGVVRPGSHGFLYSSRFCVGHGSLENCVSSGGVRNSRAYTGTATFRRLESSAPVAEPATLALIGSGLAALVRSRARTRSKAPATASRT